MKLLDVFNSQQFEMIKIWIFLQAYSCKQILTFRFIFQQILMKFWSIKKKNSNVVADYFQIPIAFSNKSC